MLKEYTLKIVLASFLLQGCTTAQSSSCEQMYAYAPNVNAQSTVYHAQPVMYVGGPLDNTGRVSARPVTKESVSYSNSSSVQVGSDFEERLKRMKARQSAARRTAEQKKQQQILRDRERKINDFLWKNEIPGVSDTRLLLKNTITDVDDKLRRLAKDLRITGRNPETDPTYIAIRNKRNKVQANLNALDDKIMNAIVSKSAGNAAETLVVSSDESAEMNAALANLQMAAKQYKDDTEKSIQSANW